MAAEEMKPILFNTEMVRAILEGRKTVTRRVIKPLGNIQPQRNGLYTIHTEGTCYENQRLEDITSYLMAPYQVNDVMYVRETWKCWRAHRYEATADICFKAGGEGKTIQFENGNTNSINRDNYDSFVKKWMSSTYPTWHPSIHMPKEAARIFLRVTDVSLERLQDMSTKEDFKKEGVLDDNTYPTDRSVKVHPMAQGGWTLVAYKERFEMIWNSTIKKDQLDIYGWDANPYVWVIEFEKIEI